MNKKIQDGLLILNFTIFSIICAFSNFSVFSNNQLRKIALYLFFVMLVIIALNLNKWILDHMCITLIGMTIIVLLYLMLRKVSFQNDRVVFLLLDIGMFISGYFFGLNINRDVLKRMFRIYVVVIAVSAIYYLMNYDTNIRYGFALKNSFAGGILVAFVFLLVDTPLTKNWLRNIILGLLFVTIFTSNSRSCMVGCITSISLYLFYGKRTLTNKFVFSLPVLFGIVAFNWSQIVSFFSKALQLNYLVNNDINRYSAGRIDLVEKGIKYFLNYPIIGIYNTNVAESTFYVESFFIDILVQFGIIGFLLYFFWFMCVYRYLKYLEKYKEYLILFFTMLVVCVFESNAPLGPGTTYAIAWFLLGVGGNSKYEL